jgi:hypothetical protein
MVVATIDFNTDSLLCPEGYSCAQCKYGKAYFRQDVSPGQLEMMLTADAEILKETSKTQVGAIGHWIIKERRSGLGRSILSRADNRGKHFRAWCAGNYLRKHGVLVPEPLAYVEKGVGHVITRSWHIFQNLLHHQDVETYLSNMILKGADGMLLSSFLAHLAVSINALCSSGAYHGDLSGKNIYTRDGYRFYLIDLDAVELGDEYTDAKRLKNHVQLYDSFCDALTDALLVPFIGKLLPESMDLRVWMPKVRSAQEARRTKLEAAWVKNGRPDKVNPLRAFKSHT